MTIARGLTRLKTIKAQINNNNQLLQASVLSSKEKTLIVDSKQSIDKNHAEARLKVTSALQQSKDLIKEFIAIRIGIARINDITPVTVAEQTFTITAAMVMRRDILNFYNGMLSCYASAQQGAERKVEKHNQAVLSSPAIDRDKEILMAQVVSFVDPKDFEGLRDFTTTFMAELDGALNEANALTQFTIE